METPYRLKNYQFAAANYAVHERQHQLLFSQWHMRAACLLGGIVWRLGRDILNNNNILAGPSNTVTVFGHGVFYRDISNDDIWCNDVVSLEEVNYICGLHHVRTGMHPLLSYVNVF
jgi:hypothetical protein